MLKKDSRSEWEKKVDDIHKQQTKESKKGVDNVKKIADIYATLKKCDRDFDGSINSEIKKIKELQATGVSVFESEKIRIQQAAIGKILVKRTMIELNHAETEDQLENAIDMLGKVIGQTKRVQGGILAGIGMSSMKNIDEAVPSNQSKEIMHEYVNGSFEVPEEITNKIDDTFVDNLIRGIDFEECLKMDLFSNDNHGANYNYSTVPTENSDSNSDMKKDLLDGIL